MIDTKENEERGRMICQTLAYVVESLVEPSEFATGPYQPPSKFEAFRAPGISIRDYLMRIHKYASCSPECFVLALVYIDRLQRMQGVVLTDLNVHRIVITSVVLAAKFFDDHYFNNAYYAKVGGVLCKEMNELEIEYLLLINFSLHVPTDTYARFYNDLATHYAFTSVRTTATATTSSLYMQSSPYYQLRHYVTEDPERAGQLVYVTDYVPRAPENQRHGHQQHHQHSHSRSQHSSAHYQQQQQHAPPPQQHQQHHQQQIAYHHHPHHQQQVQYAHYQQPALPHSAHPPRQQQQQHYSHYPRTIEEPKRPYAAAAGHAGAAPHASSTSSTSSPTPKSAAVRINSTTARASGQKRRSAVALGVNA